MIRTVNKVWIMLGMVFILTVSLTVPLIAQEKVKLGALLAEARPWIVLHDELNEFYAQHPNITLDITFLTHKEASEKTKVELATGSGIYDIFYTDNFDIATWAGPGWIAPAPTAEVEAEKDFPQGYKDALKVGGKYYGLPFYGETFVLYFRADLFEKYGLDVPITLTELRQVARKLTLDVDNDGQVDIYGWVIRGGKFYGYAGYAWFPFFKQFGGDYFDEKWEPTINSYLAKAGTWLWAKIIEESSPPDVSSWGFEGCLQSMFHKRAAMWADGSPFGPRFYNPELSEVVGKIGYAVAPYGPAGRALPLYVSTHVINAKSNHKAEAWEFCKWASNKRINKLLLSPGRYSAYEDPEVIKKLNNAPEGKFSDYKFIPTLLENMKYAEQPFPQIPEWAEIGDRLATALNGIITVGTDVDKALDDVAKETRRIMERSGYYK